MKEKALPLGLEAAFASMTLAAASFVLGSLYHYGYYSVFGLQSMISTWSVYDTMFVTWRLVAWWVFVVLLGLAAKSLWEYLRGRPLASDPSAKRTLHLIELMAIIAVFYIFADRAHRRGIQEAHQAVSASRRVEAITDPELKKDERLCFVAHIAGNYIFYSPAGTSGGKGTTYVVPESELRSVRLVVGPAAD